jgi:hypothetical protein
MTLQFRVATSFHFSFCMRGGLCVCVCVCGGGVHVCVCVFLHPLCNCYNHHTSKTSPKYSKPSYQVVNSLTNACLSLFLWKLLSFPFISASVYLLDALMLQLLVTATVEQLISSSKWTPEKACDSIVGSSMCTTLHPHHMPPLLTAILKLGLSS